MDNLTHSLVGLAVAESVIQYRQSRKIPTSKPYRRLIYWTSLIANNFPDWDYLYAMLAGGRLGYLLHHRGHTHTLLMILPQILGVLFFCFIYSRWKGLELRKGDWLWSAGVGALGLFLHIAMDGLNIYGVHPFWPFSNQWVYGDALFVVEPWMWLTLLPVMFLGNFQGRIRSFFAALFVLALLLVWFSGYVPWYMAALLTVWGVGFWRWIRMLGPGRRVTVALASAWVPVFCVIALSLHIKREYRQMHVADVGNTQLHDLAISAMPSNPLCWWIYTVETYDSKKNYRVRLGVFAPIPQIMSASTCPSLGMGEGTAELLPTPASLREEVVWFGEYRGSVESLAKLNQNHCQVDAFLRFARVPYYKEAAQDIILGDLRFDFERGLGFSEIQVPAIPVTCPTMVPPWDKPREDFFESSEGASLQAEN